MARKIKLVDATKCTGCRACQLACKQWNNLPAKQTENRGSYQNPEKLSPTTWSLIRFDEVDSGANRVKWLFRHEACMHCTDAACVKVCSTGALYKTEYGTVALDSGKCNGCRECVSACPFGIPQYDPSSQKVYKCDMCLSRLDNGLEPACVKACPTGALQFGDEDEIMPAAQERVAELDGGGYLYGDKFVGGTGMLSILQEKPELYSHLPTAPSVPTSVIVWKDWLKPLSLIAPGGVLAAAFLHYLIKGPKVVEKPSLDKKGDA